MKNIAICAFVSTVALVSGCSKSPAEPDPPSSAPQATAPAVEPLKWVVPTSWTTLDAPRSGPQKAAFHVPKVGDDKENANVEVFFFGTGAEGNPDKQFQAWFAQFDGNVGATAKREKFNVGAFEVETVEVSGTYKIALGPPVGPKKKAPMQMVKENFRLIGAVVKTPDRGNWFFKMAGPNDTVESGRGAWRTLLESAK